MDREITITVTDEEARRIQDRIDSGDYSSPADFVAALLRTELDAGPGWIPSDDVLRELVLEARSDARPSLSREDVHRQLLEQHERHTAAPSKLAR